jgi:PAS domain S-box-containing protein
MNMALDRLRNLPLSRKLTLLIVVTCGAVLTLVMAALFVFQSITGKEHFARDLSSLGEIIARNSAAAVAFNDEEAAAEILSGLSSRPDIEGACLVLASGKHVNTFHSEEPHNIGAEETGLDGHRFVGTDALIAKPVMLDGKRVGTFHLRADFKHAREKLMKFYGKTLAIVLLASLLVALALASHFQRLITAPILHLAEVAKSVCERGDYLLRAAKTGRDEVGALTDAFNEMLDQIQHRDSALLCAQDELEKRVERRTKQLANSLSLLNATLEATTDGVLSIDPEGQFTSWNSKFAAIWNFPPDMVERQDYREMAAFAAEQTVDAAHFLDGIKFLQANPECEAFDVMRLKDGRLFERYVRPQCVGDECVGAVFSFRDITARTAAEARMAELNSQWLDISRQAGMAEVASSVLHNVGNVLNSVNVSLGIASDKAAKLKTAGLGRIAGLLREHSHDLPNFFTGHPQGAALPGFLEQLAEHFTAGQQALLAELGSLKSNVEHINEIVAMQQSYAGGGGLIETLSLAEVIDDALRMNAAALNRHGVGVALELDATLPSLELDRHKILLILVNLIRNAKYACDEAGHSEKRIDVRVHLNGDGFANISVSDNGVGIPHENLTRIFEHGFTTRSNGHGFGLHSSALAAREMGGALRAHSDGPGTGATFTIELPLTT